MTGHPAPDLLSLLVCPDCSASLNEEPGELVCSGGHRFEVHDGIPLLYPADMDREHLEEEEELARMMKLPKASRKEQFILSQWHKAKEEFWKMVESRALPDPSTYVNIGCGFDSRFRPIEARGNLFVNLDIVYEMLHSLREETGTPSCVGGDVNRMPFRTGSFDHVISIDVIHHEADNLRPLLTSFRDLLRPGGRLFLADPNAWGLFQAPKSIFLPRPVYRLLRSTYHRIRGSEHRPADYEFPTNVWKVDALLRDLGFTDLEIHPNEAYPNVGETRYAIFRALRGVPRIRTHHNYHYMISATRE